MCIFIDFWKLETENSLLHVFSFLHKLSFENNFCFLLVLSCQTSFLVSKIENCFWKQKIREKNSYKHTLSPISLKNKQKMCGENPKKNGDLDKNKLIFYIKTSFNILIIFFFSKFELSWNFDSWREIQFSTCQKKPSPNFEFYYAKSSLEHEFEICYLISTFLKCFPTLKMYLNEFKNYFRDKPHSKVIIRTFKIIILNIIIPKA